MRERLVLLLHGVILGTCVAGSAPAAEPPAGEPMVAAAHALDRVQADLRGLQARIPGALDRFEAAPPAFGDDLAAARARIVAALQAAEGQPWSEAAPIVRRARDLRRAAADIQRVLDAWPGPRARARAARAAGGSGSGRITGRVTDAVTGVGVEDALLWIYDHNGNISDVTFADASGFYAAQQLETGSYFVEVDADEHIDELYDNIPCEQGCLPTAGTPVSVTDGQTTPNINFALVPLSRITGTVLDDVFQQSVIGARVDVYRADGTNVQSGLVQSDGTYEVRHLESGTYFALVRHPFYLDEAYDDVPCQPDCEPEVVGTPILVGVASTVTGIDFGLARGGSVSGRVTDAATGTGVSALVFLYDAGGQQVATSSTAADGGYQFFDLTSGNYYARTNTEAYADQLYANLPCEPSCTVTQGTPIAVTAGQDHGAVNFSLTVMGSISGTVTESGSGTPLANVDITIVNGQGGTGGFVRTDGSGRYVKGGLATGTYFVFTDTDTHLDELYNNIPCEPSCTPTTGTPIPVTVGAQTSGIDFALVRGGSITGRVVAQVGGQPVLADILLVRADGTQVGTAFGSGSYAFQGLAAGTYFARAAGFFDYAPELYRELPCPLGCNPTSGTPIAVTLGQVTTGIDFTLSALGRIAGRVTEEGTGFPVDTRVEVLTPSGAVLVNTFTNSGGWYLAGGLGAGTYRVRTQGSPEVIVDELYDNKTCEPTCTVSGGTPVVAALDSTTSGIDFSLRRTRFADVPVTHFAWASIEAVSAAGITSGCATSPLRYCPDASVNRAQMAVFLLRAKQGPTYTPPPAVGLFQDVPATDPFAPWIEDLANRGIASGCSSNPPLYCPGSPTTRGAMAPLLLVTREGMGYQPPPAVGVFQDLPASDPFARWAEELVRRHVTNGCSLNPPLYCPGAATTRAQMAVFLTATFGLPLP